MNKEIKLENGVYIMSIDARYLYRQDNPEVLCTKCKKKVTCECKCEDYLKYYSNSRYGYDSVAMTKKQLSKRKKEIAEKLKYTYEKKNKTMPNGKGRSQSEKFKLGSLYAVKMPYSLELIEFYRMAAKEFLVDDFNKQYTNAIINVSFAGAEKVKDVDNETGEIKQEIHIKQMGNKFDSKKRYFPKKVDKLVTSKTVKSLRDTLYDKGFYLDGCLYVNFMRSTSKSRTGKDLFIKAEYYNEIIKWARIGLTFNTVSLEDIDSNVAEITDIASLRAYESLVLSQIETTININADEILLVNDLYSSFPKKCSVTKFVDGRAVANDEIIDINNCIFDGQGLMHYTKFLFSEEVNEKGELYQRGMMLLRNRWLKSCVFNTDIQQFFYDMGVVGTINDMFKRDVLTNKVKLIITPSSLKFLKFSFQCVAVNASETYKNEINEYKSLMNKEILDDEEKNRKDELDYVFQKYTYEYWLENLDNQFGVVKTEHESKDYSRTLSYQIINSLPLSRKEVEELLKEDIAYVALLKNNSDVLKWHIGEYISYSKDYVFNLLMHNKEVAHTKIYQDARDKLVEKYIENMRTGAIRIGQTDYSTMVSNPYEMLLHAINRFDIKKDKPLHNKREIWCKGFKDNQNLFGARNPHVCSGNVIHLKNVHHKEFDNYFNFTENIAVMNFIEDDVPDRLQGCDTDSDAILLSANRILESKAAICDNEENGYLTPVNRIDPKGADISKRYYNSQCLSNVDHAISQNLIGRIINWSQILNSYYWNIYNDTNIDDEVKKLILNDFYNKVSMLSSMSQIEIDKAKKFFEVDALKELKGLAEFERIKDYTDTITIPKKKIVLVDEDCKKSSGMTNQEYEEKYGNVTDSISELHKKVADAKELNDSVIAEEKIREYQELLKELYNDLSISLSTEEVKEKISIIRPKFFEYVGKGKEYVFKSLDCPMDYLEDIIDNIPRKANSETYIPIRNFYTSLQVNNSRHQIDKIKNIILDLDYDLDKIFFAEDDDSDYRVARSERFAEAVNETKGIKIKSNTIQSIFNRVYRDTKQDKELRGCKKRLFEVLYNAHPNRFLGAFEQSEDISRLIQSEDGDIEIFGVKYKVIQSVEENRTSA